MKTAQTDGFTYDETLELSLLALDLFLDLNDLLEVLAMRYNHTTTANTLPRAGVEDFMPYLRERAARSKANRQAQDRAWDAAIERSLAK